MTFKRFASTLILVSVAIVSASLALAGPGQDDKAAMDAMTKAATPGEQHKQLGAMAGNWIVEVKAWMAPGQPPMTSRGNATITSVLGGRYIREEFSGDFMQMPFNGMGVTGYDNLAKQFVSSWIDNMGTGIMALSGTFDSSSNTYTYLGKAPDPMSGKPQEIRLAVRVVDKNKHVEEFFSPTPDGNWTKTMELTYTRKP